MSDPSVIGYGSTSSSIVADSGFTDGMIGLNIKFLTGVSAGQLRDILTVVSDTTVTVTPFISTPAQGDTFVLEQVDDGPWEQVIDDTVGIPEIGVPLYDPDVDDLEEEPEIQPAQVTEADDLQYDYLNTVSVEVNVDGVDDAAMLEVGSDIPITEDNEVED
jgi:hypothetical protein